MDRKFLKAGYYYTCNDGKSHSIAKVSINQLYSKHFHHVVSPARLNTEMSAKILSADVNDFQYIWPQRLREGAIFPGVLS